jgi:hypothetical protein
MTSQTKVLNNHNTDLDNIYIEHLLFILKITIFKPTIIQIQVCN